MKFSSELEEFVPSTAPLTGPFSSVKFSSELEEFVPSTAPLTGPFSEKFEEKIQPSWRIESKKVPVHKL